MYIVKRENNKFGVFATQAIPIGDEIGVWLYKKEENEHGHAKGDWYYKYPVGYYCNNSASPNTDYKVKTNEVVLTSKGIKKGEQITVKEKWIKQL